MKQNAIKQTNVCSKSTLGPLEKVVKHVQYFKYVKNCETCETAAMNLNKYFIIL